jgi:hypothetical protein
MEYDVKISHVMFRVSVLGDKLGGATLLSLSQGGSYFARSCAVVNAFMDIITTDCYGVSIFMQYTPWVQIVRYCYH